MALDSTRDADAFMSGMTGTAVINDAVEYTASFSGIAVLEDTVFDSIKKGGVDVKAALITDPATAVKAGALIRLKTGNDFSGVQLVSGSINIVF